MAAVQHHQDFVIQGPTLAPGNNVLAAIHALYFLPENYKLVFTGNDSVDQSFFKQVVTLIERDDLKGRVRFAKEAPRSDMVIGNTVASDSPEALASAILDVARTAA